MVDQDLAFSVEVDKSVPVKGTPALLATPPPRPEDKEENEEYIFTAEKPILPPVAFGDKEKLRDLWTGELWGNLPAVMKKRTPESLEFPLDGDCCVARFCAGAYNPRESLEIHTLRCMRDVLSRSLCGATRRRWALHVSCLFQITGLAVLLLKLR